MKNTGIQYIKCPRCELNYILKKDKFCDVCKSEMKAGILKESDLDELELMEEGMELCSMCKVNYVNPGETICSTCQEEHYGETKDDEPDWRGFVDKSDDNDEEIDLLPVEDDDEIDEELEGAFAEDLDDDFGDEEDSEDHDGEDDNDFDDFDDSFDSDDDEDDDDEEEYEDDDEDDEDIDFSKRR